MFRGAPRAGWPLAGLSIAGLSIALCAPATAPVLTTAPVLMAAPAGLAAASPAPSATKPAASSSPKPSSSAKSGSSGTGGKPKSSGHPKSAGGPSPAAGFTTLPRPTQQCAGFDSQEMTSGAKRTPAPWPQQALDFAGAWKFSQGAGASVAVLDSGVDANSEFGNRVYVGPSYATAPSGKPYSDCEGHGTMVAGIIAASGPSASGQPDGFEGLAPHARILTVKVTNFTRYNTSSLVSAINYAVSLHVGVIEISSGVPASPALQAAVDNAIANDVVVVASAGNDTLDQQTNTWIRTGPYYPASYPGVLSVGSVNTAGQLSAFSDPKSRVDVTAPGEQIISTCPAKSGDGYCVSQGTSFAAPFAAGEAALIRARYPQLKATEVVTLIKATAAGSQGTGTGNGLINPVRALTAVQAGFPAGSSGKAGAVPVDRAASNRNEKVVAVAVTGGALGLAALAIAVGLVIPAGRRRRWRPGEFS